MPRGGARPNTGPKLGSKHASTLSKEAAREAVRQVVMQHMHRMMRSQIANAVGIGHLYVRDKTGRFNKIENEQEAERLLTQGEENKDFYIFMKDPSVQAFTDLMNRALDKPKEQEQTIDAKVEVAMKWLE